MRSACVDFVAVVGNRDKEVAGVGWGALGISRCPWLRGGKAGIVWTENGPSVLIEVQSFGDWWGLLRALDFQHFFLW